MIDQKIRSFGYALKGIAVAWREEFNFRFHTVFALATILLGWYARLSRTEWIIVIFMIAFVLATEVLNTALEELCDKFKLEHDPHIGKIKDLAAASVLISALAACIVGVIIFLPHLIALWVG